MTTLTATQATSFNTYSVANASLVKHSLTCGCEPYLDVFTYNRWKAQGFQVQRGEKAIKIPVIKTVDTEDKDTGERVTKKIAGSGAVFCRHQVKANNRNQGETTQPLPRTKESSQATGVGPTPFVGQVMNTWRET